MHNLRVLYGPWDDGVADSSPPPSPIPPPSLVLGQDENGNFAGLDIQKLLSTRLLIQGTSGSGKTTLLKRLLRASAGKVQHLILDPEGEFARMVVELGCRRSSSTPEGAAALATNARRTRRSLVYDISQLHPRDQLVAVAEFVAALIDQPHEYWQPALVILDEVQLFAPQTFGGEFARERRCCAEALIDLLSRGRKRGLCAVLATLRLARVSKSVVAETLNLIVGQTTLDVDIRRAAEALGWERQHAQAILPTLRTGQFIALGPAVRPPPPTLIQVRL